MRIPGFTVGRQLGSAHSYTWLGIDDTTGEPVTLRLVRGDLETIRAGLSTASLVMRALQHPHVIAFHSVVDSSSGPVLVLGPAEGGSLAEILAVRRVLPPGEMVTACAPIAEALAEIHQHGIVHGAIGPEDILFARDGRPMLAGVGLASIGARLNLHGPTIAPEVASEGSVGPSADVYSVAAVGLMALTGPVSASQLFAASAEHLLATGMAPGAQAVITRAVGRNVGRRPDAETLVNALYQVADPEPVELVVPDEDEPPQAGQAPPVPPGQAPPGQASPVPPGQVPTGQAPPVPPGQAPPGVPGSEHTAAFGGEPGPGSEFGAGAEEQGEADDVAAYMRRGTGRRARRAGRSGEPSPGEEPPAGEPGGAAASAFTSPIETQPGTGPATGGFGAAAERLGGSEDQGSPPGGGAQNRRRPSDLSSATTSARRGRGAADEAPPGAEATGTTKRGNRRGRKPSKGEMTRVVSVLVVLLLLAGGAVLVMQLVEDDDELPEAGLGTPDEVGEGQQADLCGGPKPASDEAPPEVSDWTEEVQRLYELRARAFAEIDAELLCQVYEPTSEGLVRDVELLQEYADNDVRTEDLSFEVVDVELVEEEGGTVVLEVSDRLPPYRLVDSDGEVVEEKGGMEHDTWLAELVPVADEADETPTWRFG
ncbi:serine/threonine protein kinase [Phytoactinopolyspora halophila]|uniref:serine/threonine protein kinase n=1 Tax=Phytoactinopolyspora halophila TaxID=1981511 RepID=UPI001314DEA8|nr:protein kinase [Phytoactinopolyspora halophila]